MQLSVLSTRRVLVDSFLTSTRAPIRGQGYESEDRSQSSEVQYYCTNTCEFRLQHLLVDVQSVEAFLLNELFSERLAWNQDPLKTLQNWLSHGLDELADSNSVLKLLIHLLKLISLTDGSLLQWLGIRLSRLIRMDFSFFNLRCLYNHVTLILYTGGLIIQKHA